MPLVVLSALYLLLGNGYVLCRIGTISKVEVQYYESIRSNPSTPRVRLLLI